MKIEDTDKDFKLLAYYYLSLMEGDTHLIEDAYELLRNHGIVDENGERIYEDED
jgi:hypothetical protein